MLHHQIPNPDALMMWTVCKERRTIGAVRRGLVLLQQSLLSTDQTKFVFCVLPKKLGNKHIDVRYHAYRQAFINGEVGLLTVCRNYVIYFHRAIRITEGQDCEILDSNDVSVI